MNRALYHRKRQDDGWDVIPVLVTGTWIGLARVIMVNVITLDGEPLRVLAAKNVYATRLTEHHGEWPEELAVMEERILKNNKEQT